MEGQGGQGVRLGNRSIRFHELSCEVSYMRGSLPPARPISLLESAIRTKMMFLSTFRDHLKEIKDGAAIMVAYEPYRVFEDTVVESGGGSR